MNSKKVSKKSISFLLVLTFILSSCFTQAFAAKTIEIQDQIDTELAFSEQQLSTDKYTSVINSVYSVSKEAQIAAGVIGSKKTNRFIIKYKNENKRSKVLEKMKNKLKTARNLKNKRFDIISTELKYEDFIKEIKSNKVYEDIDYIQPDFEITLSSNDTNYVTQWGMENNTKEQLGINIDSNVATAWDETEGDGVTVALIDTGIDTTQKDLEKNIWVNEKEIPDNNIDDDSNGYVDDYYGWNFFDDTNEVHKYELSYDEGHGTHIAGIIAAEKDNDLGIAGVSPKAKIMALKAFSNGVAYTSDIVEAITYAQNMNVKIVNCSWGSTAENAALREIMENSNMLFICASGNSHVSIDSEYVYPASFGLDNVISVASIGKSGELSSFSNFGEINIDVAAPGEEITSTLPMNRIGQKSGTSMAAGFVSGGVALLLSKYPDISAKEMKEKIINSSDRLSTLDGKVKRANKLNIANALSGIVNDELIQVKAKAKDAEVGTELVEESVAAAVYANEGFTTFSGSSLYTAVQEVISNMISIPSTSMNGTLNAVVKGNTRTNLLLSPEMNTDSDGNGKVDNFMYEIGTSVSAIYSLDSVDSCQKIALTSSTNDMNGAKLFQWITVKPGDIVNISFQAKVSGNVKVRYYTAWFNGSTHLGSSASVYCDKTEFSTIYSSNSVVPANTTKAQFIFRVVPIDTTSTGSGWIKNVVVENNTNGSSFITTGTKSTEPIRVKSVGKNLFSDEMFYNFSKAAVNQGSISVENNRLKFVSTGNDSYIITRSSATIGSKSPMSHNKYDLSVTAPAMYYTRKIENITAASTNEYVYYYDDDRRLISYAYVGSTVNGIITNKLTPPSNAKYLHIRLGSTTSGQTIYYSEFMLSNENIAYEPYKESVTYIPVELNSMSNGIIDEVNLNTGVNTKRLEKVTTEKGAWSNTQYTNFNVYEYKLDKSNILPGSVISVNGVDYTYASADNDVVGYYYNWSDNHSTYTTNNNITLRFPKSITAPSEVTIVYQLPKPLANKLDITPVTSFSGGTVFVENAVKKVAVYNNGIAVMDKGLKISEIESVYKIKNGEKTPIDLSKVAINTEGTAFTISSAFWGEMYEYVYKYNSALSTVPTIQYSIPTNLDAQVEDNTISIKQHSEVISSLVEQVNSLKEQIDNPKRVVAGPFDISCTSATPFNVVLTAANTKDFSSRKFTVIYNTSEVTVKDLCAATSALETGVCNPVGTNISIIKAEAGLIEFIVYNPVEVGLSWSGAVNTVVFTPKSGVTKARITYIAE